MTHLDFTGRNVLVVGGSSGIGNGIAQAFRSKGAAVHVWGTRATAAEYKAKDGCELLRGMGYDQVDVADPQNIADAPAPFEKLDVLVLSQGTVGYQRAEFERPGWDQVMAVNLDSVMHCCTRFRQQLSDSAGAIVILSSVTALRAARGTPAYAASKAGVLHLTRTLGQAWAPQRIRVNGIAPGYVETKLTSVTSDNPARRQETIAAIPLRRPGLPDEIAQAALFLASPMASYVIGHTLVVDGGLTL